MNNTELFKSFSSVWNKYQELGFPSLLNQIRDGQRYQSINGFNVLVNAEPPREELCEAPLTLETVKALELSKRGLYFGLNPYTDWALSILDETPARLIVFIANDWYSINGELGFTMLDRFNYLRNPFPSEEHEDRTWITFWRWIFEGETSKPICVSEITQERSAEFLNRNRIGLIWHNILPYYRPVEEHSVGSDWRRKELRKREIKANVIEDLSLFYDVIKGRDYEIFCTSSESSHLLSQSKFDVLRITSAHPCMGDAYLGVTRRKNLYPKYPK